MKEIESLTELASCTDVSLLTKQKEEYERVIKEYCKIDKFYKVIAVAMTTDINFKRFMALITAKATLEARIKELEEDKRND